MMKTVKSLLLTNILMLAGQPMFAHALWIETSSAGQAGKTHEVKIIYAEPGQGTYEKVADWWSDVGSFVLWLTGPDGEKRKLEVSPQADHFTASFTPADEGLYTLSIVHNAEDLAGKTQYQFNATACVKVGNVPAGDQIPANGGELCFYAKDPDNLRVNRAVNLSGLLKGQAAAETDVTVFAPNGWSKSIKTGKDGQAEFVPEWRGKYLIEAGKGESVTGKAYEKIYRISTVSLAVQ